MVVLPWHNFVMVELLTFFLLSFRSSSIFFVPAQLWRHDRNRSTECPLEGKHWAACSCTNMILMFLLSAAALRGPHTALPGGSAVAQLCDGRAAHFLSFELSKLIHRPCASPIVAPRSLYRVPTGRKTLGSLQLHKHIYIYIYTRTVASDDTPILSDVPLVFLGQPEHGSNSNVCISSSKKVMETCHCQQKPLERCSSILVRVMLEDLESFLLSQDGCS